METTKYTLFTDVYDFYGNLLTALQQAEDSIYMIYFAFDHGDWANRISRVLRQKAANGVAVHLMVDEIGMAVDNVRNIWRNRALLAELRAAGIQVDVFRPAGRRLSQFNRLHAKICAIDRRTVFIGGSNIGDHYLGWRDSNLRLDSEWGDTFAQLYTCLLQFSQGEISRGVRQSDLHINDVSLMLTLPGHRQDIRRTLLDLILEAEQSVTIRTWYFLPDTEVLNALLSQAENGVDVTVLFSHHTRVPFIDAINKIMGDKLARSGAHVYRYRGRYMHAKEAWNDKGNILFGSANIDRWALNSNFECSLRLHDDRLARQLQQALHLDLCHCRQQHSVSLRPQAVLDRVLSLGGTMGVLGSDTSAKSTY
jgi:cardiolipin synthase